MRRLSTVAGAIVALVVLVGALGALGSSAPAGAQDQPNARCTPRRGNDGRISVVSVSGLLDPVLVRFVAGRIEAAVAADAAWVVLQINSRGTVASDEEVAGLLETVRESPVPVAVWIGTGSRAQAGMGQVAAVSCKVALAGTSARLGRFGEPVVDPARFRPPFQAAGDRLADSLVSPSEALKLGVADERADTLPDFIGNLDGVESRRVETDEGPRRQLTGRSVPVFSKLPIVDQLMHTVASPAVAYLLLLFGLALIVFELYTAGVGIAGLVGAGSVVLGSYGLAALPARSWAVALLVLTVLAYAVDVQTGVPRVWTAAGTVALVIGSLSLYDGLSLSWITLLAGIGGMLLFVIGAMPAMVRTRFSTPTIGRGWMIGEEGEAVTAIDPDGVVSVRGAPWKARTNRATPLVVGAGIRVVEVDGLLLEVEPIEGGARDHRERRSEA